MDNPKRVEPLINVRPLRKLVLALDNLVHLLVALILLACVLMILFHALMGFKEPTHHGVLTILNDVLLALIVMEILWPVVRFLKRAPFRINPFLYVGIMSSTRRLLMIEAEHSLAAKAGGHGGSAVDWGIVTELGVNVGVILVLAFALFLIGDREDKAYPDSDD